MASRKKKNGAGGILIGPILVVGAVIGLWKNETRFDYHKAASKTEHSPSLSGLMSGRNFSYSGEMDQSLTLPGKYIETFTGYLVVHRDAEIYCWDRDEDEDGDVTWSKRWMSSVESNSRNRGIRKQLKSGRIRPPSYEVADLTVVSGKIEFVDAKVTVNPGPLKRAADGGNLRPEGNFLMLRKGRSGDLGDERLGYRAIPIPPLATYFGRFENGKGVADTSEQRSGMINSLIQNSGILHHLVAGEREAALQTMKQHIQRLKWIVRCVGSGLLVLGLIIFFSSCLRFLYSIPLIGGIAESGAFLLSLVLGIPIALITISLGFVAGNPLLLIPIVLLVAAGIWLLVRQSKRQRKAGEEIKSQLDAEHGHSLERDEMKQLEYREMAGMLTSGGKEIGSTEAEALNRFAKKSGIEEQQRESLLEEVRERPPSGESAETHLQNLIRISVADARLTPQEVRSIREAATIAGYSREQFRELMNRVSSMAKERMAS